MTLKHDLVGKRVRIPVHFDNWMRGDTHGRVTSVYRRNGVELCRVQGEKGTVTRMTVEELFQYGRVL